MIGVDDVLGMHRHRQLRVHRTRRYAIGADAVFAEFSGLLLGQMNDGRF